MNKLIVFEGNDGVGKTTLARELTKSLATYNAVYFSSPGKERDGSLGKFVYHLHHGQKNTVCEWLPPLSIQMLHVASHISNLHNVIIPLIRNGGIAVLDRWWWSTIAYGVAYGIAEDNLLSIIQPEISLIRDNIKDVLVIYLSGNSQSGHTIGFDEVLLSKYRDLVNNSPFPVIEIDNALYEKRKAIDEIIRSIMS